MKTPARPMAGAAGVEIESKDICNRSCSTPRTRTSNTHVDVPPNWRRLGTITAKIINDLTPGSS